MVAIRLDRPTLRQRLREPYRAARALGFRERWRRSPRWKGFGEPFNGQSARRRTVDVLCRAFSPDACIETGTFFGFTARYLATYGVPVYTVELNTAFYHLSKLYLRDLADVTLMCGDSAAAVRLLATRPGITRPLVYLDAHWGELPLHAELDSVFANWRDALVAIDDFCVPHEPGYAYDIYDGTPLSLEQLEIADGTTIAYPATRPTEETGLRRGAVYLGRGADAEAAIELAAGEGLLTLHSAG